MIGLVFGSLRVLERAGSCADGTLYRCACVCGSERTARGVDLRRGHVKSCGRPHRAARPAVSQVEDRAAPVAEVYGKLRVLGRAGSTRRGEALYRCACECGSVVRVRGAFLRSGHTRSCGCGEFRIAAIAAVYGKLRVLARVACETRREAVYECACECGSTVRVRGYSLRTGRTWSCGCVRRRVSERTEAA